ncbi:hypothetical protein MTR_1g115265 [Medicago truncatula]|uniref:Uncharacterized protein n=1 Tax=Medicago truncatula TaxID=3880 RepID=A0A072VS15_MEDTR|nr:hypothetical protein MTR_1g115265 [Medicago truncatula]
MWNIPNVLQPPSFGFEATSVWDVRSSGLFWSIVKFDILFDKEASPRYCEHLKFCHKLDWHNVHISDIRS